jgi:hypothetical protein
MLLKFLPLQAPSIGITHSKRVRIRHRAGKTAADGKTS